MGNAASSGRRSLQSHVEACIHATNANAVRLDQVQTTHNELVEVVTKALDAAKAETKRVERSQQVYTDSVEKALLRDLAVLRGRLDRLSSGTLWRRLIWLVTGRDY